MKTVNLFVMVSFLLAASNAFSLPMPPSIGAAKKAVEKVIEKTEVRLDRLEEAHKEIAERLARAEGNIKGHTTLLKMIHDKQEECCKKARDALKGARKGVNKARTAGELAEILNRVKLLGTALAATNDKLDRILRGEFTPEMINRVNGLIAQAMAPLDAAVADLRRDVDELKTKVAKLEGHIWSPGIGTCLTFFGLNNPPLAVVAPTVCFRLLIKLPYGHLVGDVGVGYGGSYGENNLLGLTGSFGYGLDFGDVLLSLRFRGAATKGFMTINSDQYPTVSQFLGGEIALDWNILGSGATLGLGLPLGGNATLGHDWGFSLGVSAFAGYQF